MDWIGGKLAMLIEEGKKALGREVVVMSDSKDDEVDDGMGAWEEEEERESRDRNLHQNREGSSSQSRTRSGSRRLEGLAIPSSSPSVAYSHPYSSPSSPLMTTMGTKWQRDRSSLEPPLSSSTYTTFSSQSYSPGSSLHTQFSHKNEDEEDGISPELKEYMEKARARYRNRV